MTAPEPTLPVTDRRAYGADDDDDLPVDVVRFAQFSLAADRKSMQNMTMLSAHTKVGRSSP